MDYNDALQVLKEMYVPRNHGVLSRMMLTGPKGNFTACAWLSFVPVVMPPCDYVALGLCYYHGDSTGSQLSGRWNAGYISQSRLRELLGPLITECRDPLPHLVYSGGMSQAQAEAIIDEALNARCIPPVPAQPA